MSTAAATSFDAFELEHYPLAQDDVPGTDEEREYLRFRASSEFKATVQATCTEAETAHNALTRAYLARCRACASQQTAACLACVFRHVCDAASGPPRHPLAD